ncbi:MAG: GTPase HflX [Chitinophagales bacterium]|nr:GTPase HflX [Chitinophagales bacterium]
MSQNIHHAHKSSAKVVFEKAVLVGLIHGYQTEDKLKEYLDELAFLAQTAGAEVVKIFTQKLARPQRATFIGTGKLAEIAEYVEAKQADLVIFDDDLTPMQQNNIEKALKCKVIDRSFLILDIFARRAQTAQAKTQVELAQLQYLLPRLRGLWTHLERQRGGIGMRGPGEQEIETDRRIVKEKIARLKQKLQTIDRQSTTMRKQRNDMVRVSLVGYTNVGKSTLMNLLCKADVFAENKLFATLDTTVRKVVWDETPFLLSDTVGFIRKLPHSLIESFKSTLDEVREADILLHVIDLAHPQFEDQMNVVNATLREIGAGDKPTLVLFNKTDLYETLRFDEYLPEDVKADIWRELHETWQTRLNGQCLFISALQRDKLDILRRMILDAVQEQYTLRYPFRAEGKQAINA